MKNTYHKKLGQAGEFSTAHHVEINIATLANLLDLAASSPDSYSRFLEDICQVAIKQLQRQKEQAKQDTNYMLLFEYRMQGGTWIRDNSETLHCGYLCEVLQEIHDFHNTHSKEDARVLVYRDVTHEVKDV